MTAEQGSQTNPTFLADRAQLADVFTAPIDDDIVIDRGIAADQLTQAALCGGTSEVLLLLSEIADKDPTIALGMVTNLLAQTQHDEGSDGHMELFRFAHGLLEADDVNAPAARLFTDHDRLMVYEFMPVASNPDAPFSVHAQLFGVGPAVTRRSGTLGPEQLGLARIRVIESMLSVPEIDLEHDRELLKLIKGMYKLGNALSAFQYLDTTEVRTQSVGHDIDLVHDLLLHKELCRMELLWGLDFADNFVNNRPVRTDQGRELINAFFVRVLANLHDNANLI